MDFPWLWTIAKYYFNFRGQWFLLAIRHTWWKVFKYAWGRECVPLWITLRHESTSHWGIVSVSSVPKAPLSQLLDDFHKANWKGSTGEDKPEQEQATKGSEEGTRNSFSLEQHSTSSRFQCNLITLMMHIFKLNCSVDLASWSEKCLAVFSFSIYIVASAIRVPDPLSHYSLFQTIKKFTQPSSDSNSSETSSDELFLWILPSLFMLWKVFLKASIMEWASFFASILLSHSTAWQSIWNVRSSLISRYTQAKILGLTLWSAVQYAIRATWKVSIWRVASPLRSRWWRRTWKGRISSRVLAGKTSSLASVCFFHISMTALSVQPEENCIPVVDTFPKYVTLHPLWIRVFISGVVLHSSMASGSWKITVGRGSFRRVRTFSLVFIMVWKCCSLSDAGCHIAGSDPGSGWRWCCMQGGSGSHLPVP